MEGTVPDHSHLDASSHLNLIFLPPESGPPPPPSPCCVRHDGFASPEMSRLALPLPPRPLGGYHRSTGSRKTCNLYLSRGNWESGTLAWVCIQYRGDRLSLPQQRTGLSTYLYEHALKSSARQGIQGFGATWSSGRLRCFHL